MRIAIIILAAVVSACAPHLAGANDAGGVISNHGWSQARSFQMAEQHCRQYGKHARVSGTNDLEGTLRFDCVSG